MWLTVAVLGLPSYPFNITSSKEKDELFPVLALGILFALTFLENRTWKIRAKPCEIKLTDPAKSETSFRKHSSISWTSEPHSNCIKKFLMLILLLFFFTVFCDCIHELHLVRISSTSVLLIVEQAKHKVKIYTLQEEISSPKKKKKSRDWFASIHVEWYVPAEHHTDCNHTIIPHLTCNLGENTKTIPATSRWCSKRLEGRETLKFPNCAEAARDTLPELHKRGFVSADERSLWSLGILTGSISYLAIIGLEQWRMEKKEKMGKEKAGRREGRISSEQIWLRAHDVNIYFALPHPCHFLF